MYLSIPFAAHDNLFWFISDHSLNSGGVPTNFVAWNKPPGINMVYILAQANGSKGGAGFSGSAGTQRGGGGSGGSGPTVSILCPAVELPDTLFIGVGGQIDGNGCLGKINFVDCNLGISNPDGGFSLLVFTGSAVQGGTGSAAAGGSAGTAGSVTLGLYNALLGNALFWLINTQNAIGLGGGPNGAGSNITSLARPIGQALPGAGIVSTAAAGGSVVALTADPLQSLYPARTQSSSDGAAGLDGMVTYGFPFSVIPPTGGSSSNSGTGGKGGDGIWGCGGGGGGAGVTGGAGGKGGPGFVIIKCW